MKRFWFLLLFAVVPFLLGADACSKKYNDAVQSVENESFEGPFSGAVLALAPRMGGNVQSAFIKRRKLNGRWFYTYPAMEDLNLNMTRGLSGTGATYSRYGDPSRDPAYRGMGWAKSAAEHPNHERPQQIQKRDRNEVENHYKSWMDMCVATDMRDVVLVANMYMPFSELQDLIDDMESRGINILWVEADNEQNSPQHQRGLLASLKEKDPNTGRYGPEELARKNFAQYWDWVEELEAFCSERGLPVSYVGTPVIYAFPNDLPDAVTGGRKIGKKKSTTDRVFNESGAERVLRGKLEGAAISRHRYRQWLHKDGVMYDRNDDLRKKLSYPLARNYYDDLMRTEVQFYRSLYPGAQILLTEWGLKSRPNGPGYSWAQAQDVAKFLLATAKINAELREQAIPVVTYQSLYGQKMFGLMYFEGNEVGLAPEGRAMSLFSVMDGAPILEVGNGDDIKTQWIRIENNGQQYLLYYNLEDRNMPIPYAGSVEFMQATDLFDETNTTKTQTASGFVPSNSIGVVTLN